MKSEIKVLDKGDLRTSARIRITIESEDLQEANWCRALYALVGREASLCEWRLIKVWADWLNDYPEPKQSVKEPDLVTECCGTDFIEGSVHWMADDEKWGECSCCQEQARGVLEGDINS